MKTVTLPLYLLADTDIEGLVAKAVDLRREAEGDPDAATLSEVIEALRNEMASRGKPMLVRSEEPARQS